MIDAAWREALELCGYTIPNIYDAEPDEKDSDIDMDAETELEAESIEGESLT